MEGLEGSRRNRATALVLALAAAAASAIAGCGSEPETPVEPVAAADAIRAFAPLVRLHPDEEAFPMSVDRFVERASLKLRGEECIFLINLATGRIADRKTPDPVPRLVPKGLARPGYRGRVVDERCRPAGPTISTTQHTRPYDRASRPDGLGVEEGFYMDLLTDSYDGDPVFGRRHGAKVVEGVPAYFERVQARVDGRPGMAVTYWTLYGSSLAYRPGDPRPTKHEGDWERIQVRLGRTSGGRYAPRAVRLYAGAAHRTVPWDELDRVDDRGRGGGADATHPVVYAALASHTPHHQTGTHERREGRMTVDEEVDGGCSDCAQVETWRDLRAVLREPWYGYGGGWGLAFATSSTSGPLGPSPFLR